MNTTSHKFKNRIVVLDTETTGLDSATDRIIEIGAVVLDGFHEIETKQHYFDPCHPVSPGAFRVHGLSNEFLSQFAPFDPHLMLDLLQDSPVVIHNASFDLGFMNSELARCGLPPITNQVIDTLALARQQFPGAQANLDALCNRFKISNKHRSLHGALVDALLLSRVYAHLRKQGIAHINFASSSVHHAPISKAHVQVTEEELCAYSLLIKRISG